MYDEANSLDFWGVGKNIAVGIKEGLEDHGEWLNTIAWNTAVGMYNSACDAMMGPTCCLAGSSRLRHP